MKLTWYGHAAFLLEADNGNRVVLDPYRAPDVGTYAPIDDIADIIAISHENAKYHSYTDAVRGRSSQAPLIIDGIELLNAAQPRVVNGASFTATGVWENDERKEPIAMLGVTMDGVRVLHMGDCGHALSSEEVAACGRVDVLLALAGGAPTLALSDLTIFIAALRPRVVIPMHFGNEKINLNLRPLGDFLDLMPPDLTRTFENFTVLVTPSTLPAQTEVWVLPPAR